MSPAAIALAILLSSHSDRNVTGLCGCTTEQRAPIVVVVERRAELKSSPATPTAPSNFNYGDAAGRFPQLIELTGSVQVKK